MVRKKRRKSEKALEKVGMFAACSQGAWVLGLC